MFFSAFSYPIPSPPPEKLVRDASAHDPDPCNMRIWRWGNFPTWKVGTRAALLINRFLNESKIRFITHGREVSLPFPRVKMQMRVRFCRYLINLHHMTTNLYVHAYLQKWLRASGSISTVPLPNHPTLPTYIRTLLYLSIALLIY